MNRDVGIDTLRIACTLSVIITHLNLGGAAVTLAKWCVPVFVMISGCLWLNPQKPYSAKTTGQAIIHLLGAAAFWNMAYQFLYVKFGFYTGLNWKGVLFAGGLTGPYHFWYLYMALMLYAIAPFMRNIAVDKRLSEYFIILFLIFQTVNTCGKLIPIVGLTLIEITEKAFFHFSLGYSGYWLLGDYLYRNKNGIYPFAELLIYVLGILSGNVMLFCTLINYEYVDLVVNYLSPFVAIAAIAIFVLFVKRLSPIITSNKLKAAIKSISECCFGIYLIHAMVIHIIDRYCDIERTIGNSILLILGVFLTSFFIINAIRKIPVVGKWIA